MANNDPVAVIIEDEPQIRRFVRAALEDAGWRVFEAESAARGLADAATRKPDLVILDLGLPDKDGLEVLMEIRTWSSVPIIVLSARSDEGNMIAALDAGAEDFVRKPFGIGELMARVRVVARKLRAIDAQDHPADANSMFTFGDISVDRRARLVFRAGREIHLTPIEYRMLTTLISNVGRVLTHRQLLREIWGPSHSEHNHYLRIYMGNLRQKLELEPAQPQYFLTESGIGYRLLVEMHT